MVVVVIEGWVFSLDTDSGGRDNAVGIELGWWLMVVVTDGGGGGGGLYEETAGGQHQDVFSGDTADG